MHLSFQKSMFCSSLLRVAHYAMSPRGIGAGPFASTVPRKLVWQLHHLPCQWLMETTSRVFHYCLVPAGKLGRVVSELLQSWDLPQS